MFLQTMTLGKLEQGYWETGKPGAVLPWTVLHGWSRYGGMFRKGEGQVVLMVLPFTAQSPG